MEINHLIEKTNATIVKDETNKFKSYIVLDGHIVGIQYNFGN